MDCYPLFADLVDRPCLIVGGGDVAARKVRLLRSAGARVTVVAPKLCDDLEEAAASGKIRVLKERFSPRHIDDHLLVIAATDDEQCNELVASTARRLHRLCNVVDNPSLCSFITPAIVDRGAVTVAISTGGRSPTLARWLKARIEQALPARTGDLASLAVRWRDTIAQQITGFAARQRFWLDVFSGPVTTDVLAGRQSRAERAMTRALSVHDNKTPLRGEAYLVGAGPGDAELLTLRGARLLAKADVVMHDSLVSASVLELARRDATFINVGKRAGQHAMKQSEISERLVHLVSSGKRVCRLKGGDPFVFGRGGEEALALAAAAQRFEIVPGVTAATACGAFAGIPLTHRGIADSVSFVTAHGCRPEHEPRWRDFTDRNRTVVFYMGARRVTDIGRGLIAHGRAADTPVAIVQNGSTRDQVTRIASLAELARGELVDIASPATVIVGDVVRLARSLEWFEPASSDARLMLPGGQSTTLDSTDNNRHQPAAARAAWPS